MARELRGGPLEALEGLDVAQGIDQVPRWLGGWQGIAADDTADPVGDGHLARRRCRPEARTSGAGNHRTLAFPAQPPDIADGGPHRGGRGQSGEPSQGNRLAHFLRQHVTTSSIACQDVGLLLAVTVLVPYIVGMELLTPMAARFRLDYWLEVTGLSQRELAAKSGVSPTIVNRMSQNLAKQVSLKTLDSLARALTTSARKVKPGDLIEEVPAKAKGRRG